MGTAPTPATDSPSVLDRNSLHPDCTNCFALCCTALGFSRSADFAVDKPAGSPCRNLAADFSCTIHGALRPRGFRGCAVFDCFGAGQRVSQDLFGGISWAAEAESGRNMFAAFNTARQLHEMLWYLIEAQDRTFDPEARQRAGRLRMMIEAALGSGVQRLLGLDVKEVHASVRAVLIDISEEVRMSYSAAGREHLDAGLAPGADLIGRNLRSRRLCGADLRGAYLIAADLRFSDLSGADLLGADLRDARLDGADLSRSLYLTQGQLDAAGGSRATRLPADLTLPGHWEGG
ncbi:pentapeptide repeat-containing protein [Arthrobacter crusticola]|uniref:Pentapeptide repeat-containing protein n=1 Tax=Arthrobacter crusticola TaxID=2547960 RepID=A0A4R5U2V2_9MICC|nr:pentapeptide repeat-containing protein [Arthrobacter crusticola]TDK27957.1 pentapeptide repeat-containing protein [Arthrobacter crusticola]